MDDEVDGMVDKDSRLDAALRPAVGYLRRSTNRQEQSLEDQESAIGRYAAMHGYQILDWYKDDAISGASVDARGGFKRMLVDAKSPARNWRYLLVFDVSRFSRGGLDEAGHLRYELRKAARALVYGR